MRQCTTATPATWGGGLIATRIALRVARGWAGSPHSTQLPVELASLFFTPTIPITEIWRLLTHPTPLASTSQSALMRLSERHVPRTRAGLPRAVSMILTRSLSTTTDQIRGNSAPVTVSKTVVKLVDLSLAVAPIAAHPRSAQPRNEPRVLTSSLNRMHPRALSMRVAGVTSSDRRLLCHSQHLAQQLRPHGRAARTPRRSSPSRQQDMPPLSMTAAVMMNPIIGKDGMRKQSPVQWKALRPWISIRRRLLQRCLLCNPAALEILMSSPRGPNGGPGTSIP